MKKNAFQTLSTRQFFQPSLLISLLLVMILLTSCAPGGSTSPLDLPTEEIQKGDLSAQIVVNGSVRPQRAKDLAWQISGTVENVSARLGETVKEGQSLASLKGASLPQSVLSAKADYYAAKQALEDLEQSTDEKAASTYLELAKAQKELEEASKKRGWLTADKRMINPYTLEAAQAEMEKLDELVRRAQEDYDGMGEISDNDPIRLDAKINLANLKLKRDNARYQYNFLTGRPSETEVKEADAALRAAMAKVEEMQRTYDRLKDGVPEKDLLAAQAKMEAAQSIMKQASLTAPFEGIITQIRVSKDDEVSPNSLAFRVEDRRTFYIEVSVSEMDINRVNPGQLISASFDSIYGKEYKGKVKEISLSGAASQGVVTYPVTLQLDEVDEQIKSGMTAAVRIQTETVKDAILVPNRAVRMLENQRVVYVVKGDSPVPQPVKIRLGISSETMSQVIEGELQAGDKVITNPDTLMAVPAAN